MFKRSAALGAVLLSLGVGSAAGYETFRGVVQTAASDPLHPQVVPGISQAYDPITYHVSGAVLRGHDIPRPEEVSHHLEPSVIWSAMRAVERERD